MDFEPVTAFLVVPKDHGCTREDGPDNRTCSPANPRDCTNSSAKSKTRAADDQILLRRSKLNPEPLIFPTSIHVRNRSMWTWGRQDRAIQVKADCPIIIDRSQNIEIIQLLERLENNFGRHLPTCAGPHPKLIKVRWLLACSHRLHALPKHYRRYRHCYYLCFWITASLSIVPRNRYDWCHAHYTGPPQSAPATSSSICDLLLSSHIMHVFHTLGISIN